MIFENKLVIVVNKDIDIIDGFCKHFEADLNLGCFLIPIDAEISPYAQLTLR